MSTRKDSLKGSSSDRWQLLRGDWTNLLKRVIPGALTQFKQLWKLLLFLYVPILLLFIALRVVSHFSERITLSYLTRDIAAIADLPFFAGLVSQLGGLLWAAGLTICVFTLFTLLNQKDSAAARRFLLQGAILTGVLLFDDVFQFHEEIGEDYLGISEKIVVLGYLLLTLFFLFSNLGEILSSEYLILGLALGLFGLSIFFDAVDLEDFGRIGRIFNDQFQTFAEDGFKFAGIITWLVYFARYGYQKISTLRARDAM
jgi:hypothetical protein